MGRVAASQRDKCGGRRGGPRRFRSWVRAQARGLEHTGGSTSSHDWWNNPCREQRAKAAAGSALARRPVRRVLWGAVTDRGRVREVNEEARAGRATGLRGCGRHGRTRCG